MQRARTVKLPETAPINAVETLKALDRRIEALELRESNLRSGLLTAKWTVRKARIAYLYRTFQTLVRAPKQRFQLWPLGLTIVAPLAVGLTGSILGHAVTGSYTVALVTGLVFAVSTAAILAISLYATDDRLLAVQVQEARFRLEETRSAFAHAQSDYIESRRLLTETRDRRESVRSSLQLAQMRLLQQNWKAMRGREWERFLGSVFTVLGATVRHTGKTGDQGVDLIVELGSNRYAVQAKGYVSSVGNASVQQAVAGMALYKCNCSAVITNSRFTPAAIELAESNGCILIGENEIPALVMGKLIL
jgi:HJR/Mrr/RecB family endonuclease